MKEIVFSSEEIISARHASDYHIHVAEKWDEKCKEYYYQKLNKTDISESEGPSRCRFQWVLLGRRGFKFGSIQDSLFDALILAKDAGYTIYEFNSFEQFIQYYARKLFSIKADILERK